VIAGRYDIEREIGRGGMGAVWLGHDTVLGREVALKRIGLMPGAQAPDLERAEREARLAARLNHPHVVAVFDLVAEGDETWLVMEYVEGITLSAFVQRDGALIPDEAAALIRQAADALAAAHQAGIVHRDVKPSNMLVNPAGEVKLTDFGIAKAQTRKETSPGNLIKGKIAFMSPEQAAGEALDARSDLFSAGTMLYVMITRRHPFDAPTDYETLMLVKSGDFLAPETARPGLNPELYRVIRKAMAKAPADRYQTAEEMLVDVEQVMRLAFRAVGQTELQRWLAGDRRVNNELRHREG